MIEAVNQNTIAAAVNRNSNKIKKSGGVEFSDVLNETAGTADNAANVTSLENVFRSASEKYGVPLALLKAVAKQESNFTADAVSKSGACGIMQLMPATARGLGVEDSFDPEQNVMGGADFLSQMLKKYDGNVKLALAAYNAGPGNVAKYGGVPPFEETQNYVVKVMKYMKEDVIIPNREVISSQTAESTPAADNVPSVRIPAAKAPEAFRGDLRDDVDTDFTFEDYQQFLKLWQEQLNQFRIESQLTRIQTIFGSEDETQGRRI